MAHKTLVSLVSDQTIPNVELIKEFKDEVENYVFISTKQKTKQLYYIKTTTGITKSIDIEVNPYDYDDIENKIKKINFGDDELILNITGGTKLMSLIINDYFRGIGATIFYLTGINKEYLKVYPSRGKRRFSLQTKISLNEYLSAYGFKSISEPPYKDYTTAENIYNLYKNLSVDEIVNIFEPIRLHRNRTMPVTQEKIKDFLIEAKYDFDQNLSKKDTKYLSGDWFEEFIFYKIKNELNLNDNEIATGIQLLNNGTKNEIDVIFILNHKLYIIECKTSIYDTRKISVLKYGNTEEKEKKINLLPEIIYKSDALRNKFGLFAKTSIFTLEEIKDEQGNPYEKHKNHFDRAKLSNVTIVSKRDILIGSKMNELLKI